MVNIEGDATISNISSIKSGILEGLSQNASLSIAIKDIREMDITFLQMLLSLEGASPEVKVAVEPESEEKIREFVKSCGCHKELKMSNMGD